MSLKEKIKIFLNNFRSLPLSTKRLLSLGMVLALVVALPLFVWAIVNQRFDIRKRAATGEPTPSPTPIGNNVSWSTKWASFIANDYYIHVSDGTTTGRYFRVNPSKPCNRLTGEMVCITSDPPDPYPQGMHYMTLEVTWFEYDIEMRMFIYLYSDGKRWWSNEIRVYNGQPYPNTEWIYFYGKFFDTPVGQAFTQNGEFRLDAPDPKNNNSPVTLSFSNVRFTAFMNYFKPTPTPTSKPTVAPSPSPSPTAVPPQPPNSNPVISTKSLPVAIYGKYYSTKISGYDWDKKDKLSMGIGGLPKGVRNMECSNFFDKDGRNSITCKISGVPQSTGRHYVSVSLTDGNGGTAYKNFILWVFKPFLLK